MAVVWHNHGVERKDREDLLKQKAACIWLTGLSGSGKSTIAAELQKKLMAKERLTYILDGDNVRHGLNSDLGFSSKDREENIRRVGEVAKLMYDAGLIVIVSFISPFRKDRGFVRNLIGNFIEVHVDCSLEVCEERDPKGMYKKARQGAIKDFTGISQPYEKPEKPEIRIDTSEDNVDECVMKIISYLGENGYI
jgi:adenylylsulfate kinase